MNESDWLNSRYPLDLLDFLRRKRRSVPTPRKMRLFACACVSRITRLLHDQRLIIAVEMGHRYADGISDIEEMRECRRAAAQACRDTQQFRGDVQREVAWPEDCAAEAAHALTAVSRLAEGERRLSTRVAKAAAYGATQAVKYGESEFEKSRSIENHEREFQCLLLRDVFGNPFRTVAIKPSWLAWNDGTVVKVAQRIYDDRSFDRMPILADALEEAGCHEVDLLIHCRQQGPHVRGCWLVDLILGKE